VLLRQVYLTFVLITKINNGSVEKYFSCLIRTFSEYDDAVKKYARKCSVNKSASPAVKNNVENVKTKMTKTTGKKVKKHAPNKGKSTELAHTIIKILLYPNFAKQK
jgi:hypothetical protein